MTHPDVGPSLSSLKTPQYSSGNGVNKTFFHPCITSEEKRESCKDNEVNDVVKELLPDKPQLIEEVLIEENGCKLVKRVGIYYIACSGRELMLDVTVKDINNVKDYVRLTLMNLGVRGEDLLKLTQDFADTLRTDILKVKDYVSGLRMLGYKSLTDMGDVSIELERGRKDVLANYLAYKFLTDGNIIYYKLGSKGKDGLLFYWDKVYVLSSDLIKAKLRELASENPNHLKHLTDNVINNAISRICECSISVSKEYPLKHAYNYIAFKNGLLDVEEFINTGKLVLKPFDPNIFITTMIPHELDVEAFNKLSEVEDPLEFLKAIDPWLFERMLEWFTVSDEELESLYDGEDVIFFKNFLSRVGGPEGAVRFLLQLSGRVLTTDPAYEFMVILYSKKSFTAKSTYIMLLKNMVGDRNTTSIPLRLLADYPFSRVELVGKLLNYSTEVDPGQIFNLGELKQIISGEPITVPVKFRDAVTFTPTVKLFFACNKLPKIDLTDEAFLRRIIILPFFKVFKRDDKLKEQITSRVKTFLLASLVGLRHMRVKGLILDPYEIVKDVKEYYELKTYPLRRFLKQMIMEDVLEEGKHKQITAPELLELYNKWADEEGEERLTQKELTEKMKELGYKVIRPRNITTYVGIGLKKPNTL